MLKNAKPALKKGGTLVIIEGDPKKHNSYTSHATSKEKLIKQMNQAGYKLKKIETFLVEDNIYVFTN